MCSIKIGLLRVDEDQSKLPADLIAAYKSTLFQVYCGDEVITLKVGEKGENLRGLFEKHSVNFACYITAYNPYGRMLSKQENEARNERLKTELVSRYPIYEGVGLDPNGEWEGEASFLALGITRNIAEVLATGFEQNAVVIVDSDLNVSLLFTK